MGLPPVRLLVLDALADDLENMESLRDHGQVAPYGLALVEESDVLNAVRSLLQDGLIAAFRVVGPPHELVPDATPQSDDESLRSYWFKWTPEGELVWREGNDALDAYWTEHPPGG